MLQSALEFLSTDTIATNPARPRQTIPHTTLVQLADSIRKYGIVSPLLVNKRGNSYHIICGERRLRAAKIAGIEEVPCLVVSVEPKELALLSLAENLQREPLNLVDQAFLISKLHTNLGFSLVEIGEGTGLQIEEIERLLSILELPERIRRGYLERKITDADLKNLVAVEDPVEQEAIFKEILARSG